MVCVGANSVRPLFHNIAVIFDIAVTHNMVVCDFVIICNIAIPMLNKTAHKENSGDHCSPLHTLLLLVKNFFQNSKSLVYLLV